MAFENQIHLLDPNSIVILRAERQRSSVEDDSEQQTLVDSISRNGLINPVVVREQFNVLDGTVSSVLVAGERRLRAFKTLRLAAIPARFVHELNSIEAAIIELEENIARKDLTWQDTAKAVHKLHGLHLQLDPEWSQARTAVAISLSDGVVSRYLKISKYFDDARIMESQTVNRAEGMIAVMEGRKREAAYNALFEAEDDDKDEQASEGSEQGSSQPQEVSEGLPPIGAGLDVGGDDGKGGKASHEHHAQSEIPARTIRNAAEAVLQANFLEWAPLYTGRRFNFIHVDFPYGAVEVGPQMQGNEATIYDDSPEIYINLLNCFCDNLDRFMAQAGYIIFWYSERMGQVTRETFKYKTPSLSIQHHPLIWLHSDNAGISPDHTKYPRHIYDTAILLSRGAFPLVRLKSDAYACPTDRRLHPSTKPEPMLKYFFEMFIDEHTSMLDPTCGGGSSLRAAEALGCPRILGMDTNADYVNTARHELQDRRAMQAIISGFFDAKPDAEANPMPGPRP
jgi:ParB/RepB/Spo0J family partition protein